MGRNNHGLKVHLKLNHHLLAQWLLSLLDVIDPTSCMHAFMKPFVKNKIKCAFYLQSQNMQYTSYITGQSEERVSWD